MCELFALSSSVPTALTYSLGKFSRNGSRLRHNRDGWGIALARDRDAILVKVHGPGAMCHTGERSCFFEPVLEPE